MILEALINVHQCTMAEAVAMVRSMCSDLDHGHDPEELLFVHGLEADYAMDLLDYYSDYMDEQELRWEERI
jgi:hypothetical protein